MDQLMDQQRQSTRLRRSMAWYKLNTVLTPWTSGACSAGCVTHGTRYSAWYSTRYKAHSYTRGRPRREGVHEA